MFHLLGLRIVERARKTGAIKLILRNAVDHARRCNAYDVIDGRHHVIHVQKLGAGRGVVLDLCRPADSQRIARATKMRGDELSRLIRRTARPSPASMIHRVGFSRAKHVETAKRVECCDVLFGRAGNTILRQKLTYRAILPFSRGAVVTPDIKNECVLAVAKPVNFINDAPDLYVYVLGKSGEHFHEAALKWLLVVRDRIP